METKVSIEQDIKFLIERIGSKETNFNYTDGDVIKAINNVLLSGPLMNRDRLFWELVEDYWLIRSFASRLAYIATEVYEGEDKGKLLTIVAAMNLMACGHPIGAYTSNDARYVRTLIVDALELVSNYSLANLLGEALTKNVFENNRKAFWLSVKKSQENFQKG